MINYGKQLIADEDIAAVQSVLASPFLTQGPKVSEFDAPLRKRLGLLMLLRFQVLPLDCMLHASL